MLRKKLSEEHKRKLSAAMKGRPGYWKGKKMSESARSAMSQSGKKKRLTEEHKAKISVALKGRIVSEATRAKFRGKRHAPEELKKMSEAQSGDKGSNWQGGISPINERIRQSTELKQWRKAVFTRDDYTCQRCGVKGIRKHLIEAHHIQAFAFYPELRFEVTNGITLCEECHKYETVRLNLIAELERERQHGQKDRIVCREHRLAVLESLNTVKLIKARGYLSYWTDNTAHLLPRVIPTKKETKVENQLNMILDEAMKGDRNDNGDL